MTSSRSPCCPQLSFDDVTSYFGTSPEPWNYLLKGMTLLPDSIMGDRDLMQALAEFSEPLVRITDRLVRWPAFLRGNKCCGRMYLCV